MLLITLLTLFISYCNSPSLSAEQKTLIPAAQEFLCPPRLLTSGEITENLKGAGLDMAFHQGATNYFRFITRSDEVYFEIVFASTLPDSLSQIDRERFIEKERFSCGKKYNQFIFAYRLTSYGEETYLPLDEEEKIELDSSRYLVCEKRIIENECPKQITEAELLSILCKKTVLFYTGAGLSIASGVPAMAGLWSMLGIKVDDQKLASLTDAALANPKELAHRIKKFHDACFNSPPSAAHQALKEIALHKMCQIVTENLDYLHQRSGVMPYRVHADYLQNDIDPSTLKEIDYLICMGLSHDDRGFIGWYKKHHPEGKIIAIDLGFPTYLASEDFLLQGDLQEVIPRQLSCITQPKTPLNSGKGVD